MHIITVLFVVSYIAFDVLDLDLSDFPLQQPSHKQVVIVAEAINAAELTQLPDHDGFWREPAPVDPAVTKASIRFQDNRTIRTRWLHIALTHIHKVNFPRSSSSDSALAA
jgi:hypothetical protein